jgi:cold shock CspA family protein
MEIGTIASSDQSGGIIARTGGIDIRFYVDRVIGRDRKSLKDGDQVWFEIECSINHQQAINIRKFHG